MTDIQIFDPTPSFPISVVKPVGEHRLNCVSRDRLFDLFRQYGAVLLRGFNVDLDSFGDFARGYCPVPIHNESGKRIVLEGAAGVQSVNLGTKPFPLHPELSREPWRPDAAFFYCARTPSRHGQTTLCDGVEIVRQLPDDLRDEMSRHRIRYSVNATPADLQFWLGSSNPDPQLIATPPANCPFVFEYRDGQLVRSFTRPLLHRTRFQRALAWGNFILFARYLRGVKSFPLLEDWGQVPDTWVEEVKRISDRLTVPIGWREGDVVMVDNSRFMHGRTEVVPGDRRMIATYFGYLANGEPDPEEPFDPPWRREGFAPPSIAGRGL